MKRSSTPLKSADKQAQPVVSYPDGYKGQALLPCLIFFSSELPPYPIEFLGFIFKMLLQEFAKEVGCGKTASSQCYLDAIKNGTCYFWIHDELPEIALVSTVEKLGKECHRLLKVMPREQMLEIYFPNSTASQAITQSCKKTARTGNAKNPKNPIEHTLH